MVVVERIWGRRRRWGVLPPVNNKCCFYILLTRRDSLPALIHYVLSPLASSSEGRREDAATQRDRVTLPAM